TIRQRRPRSPRCLPDARIFRSRNGSRSRGLIEDLTASHQGGWYSLISLHGGGSPEAMKREIWRNYTVSEKSALVEGLLDRGVIADGQRDSKQPGRCCVTGCEVPALPRAAE